MDKNRTGIKMKWVLLFIGILYFKEPYSIMKIVSIFIIVTGVIMLNLSDLLLKK